MGDLELIKLAIEHQIDIIKNKINSCQNTDKRKVGKILCEYKGELHAYQVMLELIGTLSKK